MATTPATDTSAGTQSILADTAATGAGSRGDDGSLELIAKARYDAFRLMTEARSEADEVLDQARAEAGGTVTAAEIVAESTIAKAKEEAAETIIAAKEEAAAIVASALRTAGEHSPANDPVALTAEHRELSDRVSTLRVVADQLEERFAALASTAGTPIVTGDRSDEPTPSDSVPAVVPEAMSASEASVTDTAVDLTDASDRGSFYNRRSANLPRLGQDNGQNVNDMTRIMRESLDRE